MNIFQQPCNVSPCTVFKGLGMKIYDQRAFGALKISILVIYIRRQDAKMVYYTILKANF